MKDNFTSQVSFWAYDFFGYLLPGAFLLASFTKANLYVHEMVSPHWGTASYADYAILICIAYTLGHVVSSLSSYLLEKLILRKFLGYPTIQMFKEENKKAPVFERIFSPGYFRSYSNQFQSIFKKLFDERFGLKQFDEHDYFWLTWSYVVAREPVAYRRATHFLELYGFTRNMSMTFILIGTATWWYGWSNFVNGYLFSSICFVFAIALFSNYTKLLRRLNDEIFRAFVALHSEKIHN